MRSTYLIGIGISVSFLGLGALGSAACGSIILEETGGTASSGATPTTSVTTPTTNSTGATGGPSAGEPPAPPMGAQPGDGTAPQAFAFTKIYLGGTDRTGAPSPTAWNAYGYDIDHQVTTNDFSGHCKPSGGASPVDTFTDGLDGRDNAFGKNLLPLIHSADMEADFQASNDTLFANGARTMILDLPGLGKGSSYDPVSAFYLRGESKTATQWLLQPESLNGNTADSAKAAFSQSYLTNNTWVSGLGTIELPIDVNGFDLDLRIHVAVITMDLAADHSAATNGTISGVLDTEEFVSEVSQWAGALDASLCTGSTLDSILNRMRQASDILKDGTQDPTKVCDGISIGLGFDASSTSLGGLGAPLTVVPDPCN